MILIDVFITCKVMNKKNIKQDRWLETRIQSTIKIEDSSTAANFVDDNSILSTEICSGHIESWANAAMHTTVPAKYADIISIRHDEVLSIK
jgi:hypothetical protein